MSPSWTKTFVLTSVISIGIIGFDLQLSPALQRVVARTKKYFEPTRTSKALSIQLPAQETMSVKVELPAKPEALLQKALTPQLVAEKKDEPALPPNTVAATVTSEPTGAAVIMEGKAMGLTPFHGTLPTDRPTKITLLLTNYEQVDQVIQPKTAKPVEYHFALTKLAPTVLATAATAEVDADDLPALPAPSAKRAVEKISERRPVSASRLRTDSPLKAPTGVPAGTPLTLGEYAKREVNSDKFYTVQVESVREEKEASFRAALFQESGFSAYVCAVDAPDKGRWFRIRVGQFDTQKQAESQAKRLKKEGVKPWVVYEDGLCPKLISAMPWETVF